jgi:hypothetical protein
VLKEEIGIAGSDLPIAFGTSLFTDLLIRPVEKVKPHLIVYGSDGTHMGGHNRRTLQEIEDGWKGAWKNSKNLEVTHDLTKGDFHDKTAKKYEEEKVEKLIGQIVANGFSMQDFGPPPKDYKAAHFGPPENDKHQDEQDL